MRILDDLPRRCGNELLNYAELCCEWHIIRVVASLVRSMSRWTVSQWRAGHVDLFFRVDWIGYMRVSFSFTTFQIVGCDQFDFLRLGLGSIWPSTISQCSFLVTSRYAVVLSGGAFSCQSLIRILIHLNRNYQSTPSQDFPDNACCGQRVSRSKGKKALARRDAEMYLAWYGLWRTTRCYCVDLRPAQRRWDPNNEPFSHAGWARRIAYPSERVCRRSHRRCILPWVLHFSCSH